MKSSPICLLSKASKSKSWLWHRRLNHLNFDTINDLARKDLVRGLPRLKFEKDHLCSACQLGKSKKYSHKPKTKNTNMEVLHTLHMDLCGPIRVQSINGKKYILVIVDDYSRFTWVKFLRSKDETPEFVINFLKSVLRTPQQNGVVERRNVLPTNKDLELLFQPMFDEYFEVTRVDEPIPSATAVNAHVVPPGTSVSTTFAQDAPWKGYRIYNKRTRRLMETIHVTFDEMDQKMAPVRISSGTVPVIMTPGQSNQGSINRQRAGKCYSTDLFDEHLEQSRVDEPVPSATEVNAQVVPPGTSLSTTIAQDAPSTSASSSTSDSHLPVQHQEIPEDTPIIHDVPHPSHNLVTGDPGSAQSSSGNVNAAEPNQVNYPPDHIRRWIQKIFSGNIGWQSFLVNGINQKTVASDALWCCFHTELSKVEPKNFKMAVIEDCWFQAMQDEIHEFDRLEVWELVPRPIYVMVIALKWIYKVKLDEYGDVLKNKARQPEGFEDQENPTHVLSSEESSGAVDPTLFTRKSGKHILLVQIYVDDIIFASTDLNACNIFSKEMSSKFHHYVDDGTNCLGIRKRQRHVTKQLMADEDPYGMSRFHRRTMSGCCDSNPLDAFKLKTTDLISINSLVSDNKVLAITLLLQHRYSDPKPLPKFDAEQNVPAQHLTRLMSRLYHALSGNILRIPTSSSIELHLNVPVIYHAKFWKTNALAITPVKSTHPFELSFRLVTGQFILAQPVRDRKTSASDKPRHPVLQMLWESFNQTNFAHAKLIWEEFYSRDPDLFSSIKQAQMPVLRKAILSSSLWTILLCNILLTGKVERERERMAIPDPLITESIQQSSYYPKYLKMVAANTKKTPQGSASMQPATKRATPKKPTTTTPVKQSKLLILTRNLPSEETGLFYDPDLELAKKLSLETHQEKGKGEGDDADLELAIKLRLDPALLPQRQAPVGGVTIRDPCQETLQTDEVVEGKGPFYNITTSLPEIYPFIALSDEEVARLEQEMSDVKKTDHLLVVLDRHTAEFNRENTCVAGPESVKNQESEKSPKEIIKAKKEKDEEKQDSTYSIRSTDKVDLEEFDLKSALFSYMNQKKSANKNPTNHRLYHALMEALIADEDAMDKEVADKVKDHKRKHDSDDDEDDDDDDDEGPSAGSNQGRSTKRRKSDSAASGSAKPPPKESCDQSSKRQRESEASASKQHPSLSSTGWQITDTREAGVDSSMHRSDPESEHSEQSTDDMSKQDEGNVSDMEDTDNAHIPKVSTTTWFKPIPESERPATPEPEWTIPPNDFPEPEHNWANAYASSFKVPEENKLQRKTYDIGSFIKWFCRRTGKKKLLQARMDECHKLLTNKVDVSNPEGHQILRNIYEPLPLGGPPGQEVGQRMTREEAKTSSRNREKTTDQKDLSKFESFVGGRRELYQKTDHAFYLIGVIYKVGMVRTIPNDQQNRRDLPRDNPLVSVEVLSHEVSVSTEGVEELKGIVKIKGVEEEALLSLRQKPEIDHSLELAGRNQILQLRIVKDVEVHIEKLKLLNDFYVIDMKKDPETPLLVGRGFLATANAVIDCRMAKIAVGEGITRSVFRVKGVDLGEEEAPYWTTLGKRESYKPRPRSDGIGARTPYYARKDFLDCHLPGEWEIARDAELNPFKDTLVFRRMVIFDENKLGSS
ncbi:putative ribonuclease H-like domain-containing protein [Tanacetum coccineum]